MVIPYHGLYYQDKLLEQYPILFLLVTIRLSIKRKNNKKLSSQQICDELDKQSLHLHLKQIYFSQLIQQGTERLFTRQMSKPHIEDIEASKLPQPWVGLLQCFPIIQHKQEKLSLSFESTQQILGSNQFVLCRLS